MNIELHIDTLVLSGIGAGRQQEIRAAMERELAALLAQQGVAGSRHRETTAHRLETEGIRVAPLASAESIGAQLAGAIYRGLLG